MSSVFIEDFKKHSHKGYCCAFCKHGHCDIVHYIIHHLVDRGPDNKFPLEFRRGKPALLNKGEALLSSHNNFIIRRSPLFFPATGGNQSQMEHEFSRAHILYN